MGTKIDVVREYIRRFPNTPHRSLAKKMYKDRPELFKDFEDARFFIRKAKGQTGEKMQQKIAHKELFGPSPYKLPKSLATGAKVFRIPSVQNNVLVISDLHIPFQDNKAIECALKYGKEQKVNTIFINGDLMDFFMISRFVKLERRVEIEEELKATRSFVNYLRQEFPTTPIYLLEGNHEMRFRTYLATKAPELLGVEEFKLEHLFPRIKILEDTTLVKMGKLNVTHGHKLLRGFFTPVNPARGAFLRAKSSTLIGHLHKVSTHAETTITGKAITCYSTGCLCELNPDYAPFANNFSHGFAHVTFASSGAFKVKNLQILNGEIVS